MKELEQKIIDQTELHAVKPVKKGLKYVVTLKPFPGQKVFQLELTTSIITEAEYENNSIDFKTKAARGKLIMKENCLYCCSINFKNADRIFHRMRNIQFKKKK